MRPSFSLTHAVAITLLSFSCARTVAPQSESETHFLGKCSASCDVGLECLCGACTRACEPGTDVCDALASGATCTPRDGSCNGSTPANLCDVACTADSDCDAVGANATCEEGNCRVSAASPGVGGESGGNTGNGGGSAGAGSGGSDGPNSCDEYVDPTDPPSVTFMVTNQRPGPIVLGGQGCSSDHVAVVSLNNATPGEWQGGACGQSCGTALSGFLGCLTVCSIATPIVLRPGESAPVEWVGLVGESVPFDEACCSTAPDTSCPSECTLLRPAAAGDYTATLAYADVSEFSAVACEADQLNCPLGFGGVSPTLVEVPFTLGEDSVDLEITGGALPEQSCEELAEPATEAPVTLSIRNGTTGPVVLDSWSDCPDFFTVQSANESTPGSWSMLWCGGRCEDATGPQPTCGACETPMPTLLDPGESTDLEWPALIGGNISFPVECCDTPPCVTSCTNYVAAAPGAYNITLRVGYPTAEEATLCEQDPLTCPASAPNGGATTPLTLSFQHTGEPVLIEIPGIQ